jgi:hypothetical protein
VRNYNQKRRDMASSVLPSTIGPRAQRERRNIHRTERAGVRAMLHHAYLAGGEDGFDDIVDLPLQRSRLEEFVYDRRMADKVAPLIRWARRIVETDPGLRDATVDERLAYFRAILPTNLSGRHALSHLRTALDPEWEEWRESFHSYRRASRPSVYAAVLLAGLNAIVAAGLVGELNRALKAVYPAGYVATPDGFKWLTNRHLRFHGGPDVDRFLAVALKHPGAGHAIINVAPDIAT